MFVPKKDGTLRLCVDYCQLNSKTTCDTYPMPRADDLIDRVGNASYITTLDLTKGYYQVPMEDESKEKTAFATPIGLYQFQMMPFGLKGAPATFQRLMDHVLRGLDFCDAFFDDIEIRSADWNSHLRHLCEVFARLQQANLTSKPKKCRFAMPYCSFLGHIVGQGCVMPGDKKVIAVRDFKISKTKAYVRSFLGLAGYYRRFVPNFATVAAPLTQLTKKDSPDKVKWHQTLQDTFDSLKNILTSSGILTLRNTFICRQMPPELALAQYSVKERGIMNTQLPTGVANFYRGKLVMQPLRKNVWLLWKVSRLSSTT